MRFLVSLLAMAAGFAAYSYYLYENAPIAKLTESFYYRPIHSSEVRLAGLAAPDLIHYEDVPTSLTISIVAKEDPSFFYHGGISISEIKTVISDYLWDGAPLRGASTISQQVIKNAFLTPHRSFYRKYVEILYALRMEQLLTKEQIFSLYASMVEMAPDVYGLEEGAYYYFKKPMADLSPAESAFLATIISAPTWSLNALRTGQNIANVMQRMEDTLQKQKVIGYYLLNLYAPPAAANIPNQLAIRYLDFMEQNQITGADLYYTATIRTGNDMFTSINQKAHEEVHALFVATAKGEYRFFHLSSAATSQGASRNPNPNSH